jgi:hypothetical protein
MEIPDCHPFPFSSSIDGLAVETMKRKLEVSKGLFESADGALHFHVQSRFLLDSVP